MKKFSSLWMIVVLMSLMSCDKNDTLSEWDVKALPLTGTYELTGIHWSGLPLDINGDGISRWELMEEYKQKTGYEFTYTATIKNIPVKDQQSTPMLSVVSYLPIPKYTKKDEQYAVSEVVCAPILLYVKNIEQPYYGGKIFPYDKPQTPSLSNLSDMYEVSVSELDKEHMRIRVWCTLLYNNSISGKQEANTDYLYFTFEKEGKVK